MKALKAFKGMLGLPLGPPARYLTSRKPIVLFYHRFGSADPRKLTAAAFERQLQYLAAHFNVLPLAELLRFQNDPTNFSRNSVAITVDDAYSDFHQFAYPILQKYRLPVTLFVVSDFAAQKSWLWFDKLQYLCHRTRKDHIDMALGTARLRANFFSKEQRTRAWMHLADHGLSLSPAEQSRFLMVCEEMLGVTLPDVPPPAYAPMSFRDLRALDPKLVTFGAHSKTHPILARCTDAEQRTEIFECKQVLQKELGEPIRFFCYPNGKRGDFNDTSQALVSKAGYFAAFSAVRERLSPASNRFCLPRVGISMNYREFTNEVNGLTTLQALFTKRIKGGGVSPLPASGS